MANINGNNSNNTLTGTAGNDVIQGKGGHDTLIGLAGNDRLDGGTGSDTLRGGIGNDVYVVDSIFDVIDEEDNTDSGDRVDSSISVDLAAMYGGAIEHATLTGKSNINATGNAANNMLNGNGGDNVLDGADGNDTLNGGSGADTLAGGTGNDLLDGGTGADLMKGGSGNDSYVVDNAGDVVDEEGSSDTNDQVLASVSVDISILGGSAIENVTLTGKSNIDATGNASNNSLIGNSEENTLDGDAGNDVLQGFDGKDVLIAGSGNDWLDGGPGSDSLKGGSGNDTYVIDDAGDHIDEEGNADSGDSVWASISIDLASIGSGAIENARLTGNSAINATGNTTANQLVGNDAANVLDGGVGDDALSGGGGNDTLLGGIGDDWALLGGAGNDSIDGGAGNDTVFFGGKFADYQISVAPDGTITVLDLQPAVNGDDGADTIINVETIRFQDATLNFGHAPTAPTDIDAGANTILETASGGELAGITAKSFDIDYNDTVTYGLVDDAAGRFVIDAVTGVVSAAVGATFDAGTESTLSIVVRATDSTGKFADSSFTIAVQNVNQAPESLDLIGTSVFENAAGAVIGAVSAFDPDPDDVLTYSVDDVRFEVMDGQLKLKDGIALDFEAEQSVTIAVTATDAGGLSTSQSFDINVINVDEPAAIDATLFGTPENSPGTVVGIVSVSDPDGPGSYNLSVDDPRFEIVGNLLKVKNGISLDYETESSIPLIITATDGFGSIVTSNVSVNVLDIGAAPVEIQLSSRSVEENSTGAFIGSLAAIDPDLFESHVFSVEDERFEIAGTQLKLKDGVSLDYETEPSILLEIKATDPEGLSVTQTFTIEVVNANEGPVIIASDRETKFAIAATYPTGAYPWGTAAADFNNDGLDDLAVANTGPDTVSILLADGNGGLTPSSVLSVIGSNASSVSAGDVNGDGNADLLAVSDLTGNLSVFLGDGTGGFVSPVSYALGGTGAVRPELADINQDGKLDVVTANYESGTLSVLFGDGAGAFSSPTTFSTGAFFGHPTGVDVADVNGDGNLDLLSANHFANSFSLLLGDGKGGFSAPTLFSTNGLSPTWIESADLNEDGNLDVIVANRDSDNLSILFGNGSGGFSSPTLIGVDDGPYYVEAVDLDGDGHQDLVVASYSSGSVKVLLGDGDGSFAALPSIDTGGGSISVAVGDFNGDSLLDFATGNLFDGTTTLVLQGLGEIAEGAPDEGTALHTLSGSINFKDVDVADIHTVSILPGGSSYRGTLNAVVLNDTTGSGTGGLVTWDFSVSDADIDDLDAGETLSQTYTITIDDGNGGTISQDVTITLVGAADATASLTLTTGADTIIGTPGDDLIIGADGTLNDADQIDGGAGYDTLNYSGTGNLSFANLAQFAGIEEIVFSTTEDIFIDATFGEQTIKVDNQRTSNGPTVYRFSNTIADISGGDFFDQFSLEPTAQLAAGSVLDGGLNDDWLHLSGQGTIDLRGSTYSSIETVLALGSGSGLALLVDGDVLAQLTHWSGSAGPENLVTSDAELDLSPLVALDNIDQVTTENITGTKFIADDLAIANHVMGGTGRDTLEITNLTLSQAERDYFFGRSIEIIHDASGFHAGSTDNQIIGTVNADTIIGGGGNDSVEGGTGVDTYYHSGTSLDGDDLVFTGDDGLDRVVFTTPDLFDLTYHRDGADLIVGAYLPDTGDYDGTVRVVNHYAGSSIAYVLIDTLDYNEFYGPDAEVAKFYFTTDVANGLNQADGAEILLGGDGNDVINGNGGYYEVLYGNAGDDILNAGDEDAWLRGGGGSDTLNGGAGDDRLRGDAGDDVIDGGDGFDRARYNNASGGVIADLAVGAADARDASGDSGHDSFVNVEALEGSEYADLLYGNADDNLIRGRNGDDLSDGRDGDDLLQGDDGNDTLGGGAGEDNISGGSGHDALDGGSDDDSLSGGLGNDAVAGGDGEDLVDGNDGDDHLDGGSDNDFLRGGDGSDTLVAGEGNDRLSGGAGSDSIDGGAGYDNLAFEDDDVENGVHANLALGVVIDDGFGFTDSIANVDEVTGTAMEDILVGDNTDNFLWGNEANDTLTGGAGSDIITGGEGSDTFEFLLDSSGYDAIVDFDGALDRLSFYDVLDSNGDAILDLVDLEAMIAALVDDGSNVLVSFTTGASLSFEGVGTGSVSQLSELLSDPGQVLVA